MTSSNETAPAPECEKLKKCPCECGKGIAVILVVLLVAGAVCWHVHRPKPTNLPTTPTVDVLPGKIYTVQFRRDALGAASNLPIGPNTDVINGAVVSIRGELIAADHDAILLDQVNVNLIRGDVPAMKRFWIPKNSILSAP